MKKYIILAGTLVALLAFYQTAKMRSLTSGAKMAKTSAVAMKLHR